MWLPIIQRFLFNVESNKALSVSSKLLNEINSFPKMKNWYDLYSIKYYHWLENDDPSIYDIHHKVNNNVISSLLEINSKLDSKIIL